MTETSHPQTHSQRANSVNVGEHVPRKWPNWSSSFAAWVLTKRGWRVEGELINQKKSHFSGSTAYIELGLLYWLVRGFFL